MEKLFVNTKSIAGKAIAVLSLGVLAVPAFSLSPPALTGWTVQNGKLMDPNGNPFIFRGVTIDHTRAPDKTVQALKDIAALGANSAQIEFPLSYQTPFLYPRAAVTELIEIIRTCAETKLVCVLEPNDVAGFGAATNTASPSATIDLWQASDMKMALSAPGVTNHIIIGMGNQHFGSGDGLASFYKDTMQSYTSWLVSSLPPNFLVMIDGTDWSQDSDKTMHQLAFAINQNGTLKHRVIYSVDFFSDYVDPEKVRDYIASFAEVGAPLVVGGFGPVPYYHPLRPEPLQQDAPQLPAASVMQYAEQYGVGYFGWSWSGNKNPVLDVVTNYNANALTGWGNLLFNNVNGIKATAKPASIFSNGSSSSSSSSVVSNQPPVARINWYISPGYCGKGRIIATAENSSDPDGDVLAYNWKISEAYTLDKTSMNVEYNIVSGVQYTLTLTVTDSKGASSTKIQEIGKSYFDYCPSSSSSSSSIRSSSSIPDKSSSSISSSSSIRPSSSSVRTSSSSSVPQTTKALCSYHIQSQWNTGFTAAIRIKNTSNTLINGWDVSWQYNDGSKVTNLWNATLGGSNPYNAKNLNWNSTIQPGQTVEFGFQGSKSAAVAPVPVVTGAVCQ